jgi:MFS family permease
LTAADIRPDIYAWYSLIGTSGAALGILSCGWLVHHLHNDLHWDHIPAYQLIFYLYAGFGILKVILALSQSSAVEADKPEPEVGSESEPLLQNATESDQPPAKKKSWFSKRLLPKISAESKSVIASLCVLFALDSFASGLIPL